MGVARAQDAPPPAYLAIVEGTATLDRDGQPEPAAQNMPFVPGDRLTTLQGRVEVVFPDGSTLDVDQSSVLDLESPIRVNLSAGRAILVVPRDANPAYATRYEIDTPRTSIVTSGPGRYRVDAASANAWPGTDVFDRWSAALHGVPTATTSAPYLPQDLQTYGGALDRNGSWQYAAPYGYVWYPTVAPDWRPYYYGSWSSVPSYGWTWIGLDAWSWPTHHYGRWGNDRNAWFWIPGRTWGAAWVSWAAAPGYVSWCPLGFDSRSWSGWTVMPRASFGVRGYSAHRHAIDPRRLASNTPFIVQSRPPVATPHAASRAIVMSPAAPAGVAVPRVGTHAETRADSRESIVNTRPRDPEPRTTDYRRPPTDSRVSAPRRTYPIARPRAPETLRATPPGGTRVIAPESPRVMTSELPRAVSPRTASPPAPSPRTASPPPRSAPPPRTEPSGGAHERSGAAPAQSRADGRPAESRRPR